MLKYSTKEKPFSLRENLIQGTRYFDARQIRLCLVVQQHNFQP